MPLRCIKDAHLMRTAQAAARAATGSEVPKLAAATAADAWKITSASASARTAVSCSDAQSSVVRSPLLAS